VALEAKTRSERVKAENFLPWLRDVFVKSPQLTAKLHVVRKTMTSLCIMGDQFRSHFLYDSVVMCSGGHWILPPWCLEKFDRCCFSVWPSGPSAQGRRFKWMRWVDVMLSEAVVCTTCAHNRETKFCLLNKVLLFTWARDEVLLCYQYSHEAKFVILPLFLVRIRQCTAQHCSYRILKSDPGALDVQNALFLYVFNQTNMSKLSCPNG